MLTVEIRDADEAKSGKAEVEIYCDSKGIDEMIRHLNHLKSGESHVHLMSPAWAGNELSEERPERDVKNVIVHHLKVVKVPD